MMKIGIDFVLSAVAAMGFAIFFNIPRRVIPIAGITGGSGWVVSVVLQKLGVGTVWAFFAAAVLVSFLAEIFARKTQNPSTLFSIPGIYPLVPGYGLYNTMYHFTAGEMNTGIMILMQTLGVAGAIAVGIITMNSIWSVNKKLTAKKHSELTGAGKDVSSDDALDKLFE